MSLFDLKISKGALVGMFILLIPVFLGVLYLSVHKPVIKGTVKQVINSNSFLLDNGDIVRFYCIKALSPNHIFYDGAVSYLKLRILGKSIVANPIVFAGGDNIEKEMLDKGYARLKRDSSGKSLEECRRMEFDEMKAQEEKKGMWKNMS